MRIVFENHLPEPTTVHWHGIEVPINMDGVPAISQPLVKPGGTYTYEFTLHQHGTFFYHSHMPMQEMMGLIGMFVIHPKKPYQPRVDKDFALILQEWAILPNNTVPNSMSMEFNWLTINGKSGPATTPLIVKLLPMMNQMVSMVGPMTHVGTGMHAGMGMEEGMGMARQGQAMSEEMGPGLGRGMGIAMREKPVSHMVGREHHQGEMGMENKRVPGFPQDMWMPMDEAVTKPETYGLMPGWSGAVTGMMTLVRILPPEKYGKIMKLIEQGWRRNGHEMR